MKTVKINVPTPSSSTGSMDTTQSGLRACVDWVGVTLKNLHTLNEISQILQIPESDFELREVGYQGYTKSATYGSIMVMWEPPANTVGMGVHVEMSGQACREYEKLFNFEMTWSSFFALIMNFEHKFSRLDLALDDFKGYFTIEKAINKAKDGCVTAHRIQKARVFEEFYLEDGANCGRTFYIGKSDWMVRFYDKYQERLNKGVEMDDSITFWNRYEIQLRNEFATACARVLAFESYSTGEFIKAFFKSKIDFKIKNKNDKNRSRWKSCKWWEDFLKDIEPLELTQVAPDPTIPRINDWIERQVKTSLATLSYAFDGNPVLMEYFLEKGKEQMSRANYRIADEFKNDTILKSLYLRDMKDYLKEKNALTPYDEKSIRL